MGDADITLRHLARRRPEDLVRAFVPESRSIEVLGWVDSQVTNIERRLDLEGEALIRWLAEPIRPS